MKETKTPPLASIGLGWDHAPFDIPEHVEKAWRKVGRRGARAREEWEARLAEAELQDDFVRAMAGGLPDDAFEALDAAIAEANKAKLEERQRIPLSWRLRGAWDRLWAHWTGGKARVR